MHQILVHLDTGVVSYRHQSLLLSTFRSETSKSIKIHGLSFFVKSLSKDLLKCSMSHTETFKNFREDSLLEMNDSMQPSGWWSGSWVWKRAWLAILQFSGS
jgi:hypothetical protein